MPTRPPSRRQQQDARRTAREQREAERTRRRRRQNWLIVGGSVLGAGAIFGLVALSIHNRGGSGVSLKDQSISPAALTVTDTTTANATADPSQTSAIQGVSFYKDLENKAVATKVTYDPAPPVGGPYNAVWLNCGIYNDPVPAEYAVHDLERGAVWITYQPDLDTKSVDALIKLVKATGGSITLSPFTGLTDKVVATAWGVQLKLGSATDPRLAAFVKTYRDYAKAPEPNAGCTGGIGQPRGTVVTLPSTAPTDLSSAVPDDSTAATVTPSATAAPTPTTTATP